MNKILLYSLGFIWVPSDCEHQAKEPEYIHWQEVRGTYEMLTDDKKTPEIGTSFEFSLFLPVFD